ncbi:hypothetical protein CQ393_10835 [Stenotrophomonas sp. MYb238]|uniref:ankyrin repeat domain-containing protein n=1 Tax=Stenotrophomonas sp. MYb238 TaxID=2040281 RepID=UPI0012908CAB|nr:ankyrin repeat domain-containing protein [Stenotrophomonas sp. MYb238]MQP76382.1 hypothetical protein [Stenotrophomonas sp. MYb238]
MKKLAALALLVLCTSPALAESRYAQARALAFDVLGHQYENAHTSGNVCALGLPTKAQRSAVSAALASVEPPLPESPDPTFVAAFVNPALLTERSWLDPLILATFADDVAMLERMEASGHPLQERAGGLLQDAVHAGARQVLDYLLARGAAPDATNESGVSALIVAAANNRIDMARVLLQAGASPNLAAGSGATALRYAVGCRNQPMVDLLLAAGAAPDEAIRQSAIKRDVRLDAASGH